MNDTDKRKRASYMRLLFLLQEERSLANTYPFARRHLDCAAWHVRQARSGDISDYDPPNEEHPTTQLVDDSGNNSLVYNESDAVGVDAQVVEVNEELKEEAQAIRDWLDTKAREIGQIRKSMLGMARDYDRLILKPKEPTELLPQETLEALEGKDRMIRCPKCSEDILEYRFDAHRRNCHQVRCPRCRTLWSGVDLVNKWHVSPFDIATILEQDGCPNCNPDAGQRVNYVKCPLCDAEWSKSWLAKKWGIYPDFVVGALKRDGCPNCEVDDE